VYEIATLLGAHRITIRRWLKSGLKAIDDRRPTLVFGADLKSYLAEKQRVRRRKCSPDQFYCFKCREPRKAWGGTADATGHTEKIVRLIALCTECGRVMHKMARRADLAKLMLLIDIRHLREDRLIDCTSPSLNADS
jgi:hypothetical protein